jgi:hypothetical protein
MSLVHLKAELIKKEDLSADYSIKSCDFCEKMTWQEIGILKIDRVLKSYDFFLVKPFDNLPFIPPSFYSLEKEEQEVILKSEYQNHSYGAWSMTIDHWANKILKLETFPETFPL